MSVPEKNISQLGERLAKEALDNPSPRPDTCLDLMKVLETETSGITIGVLETTKIGKLLTKAARSFKRHRRTANPDEAAAWGKAIDFCNALVDEWKTIAEKEAKKPKSKKSFSSEPGPPNTIAEYRSRLVKHNKDIYKDPPVLPPANLQVESKKYPPPKRIKQCGSLNFTASDPDLVAMLKDFHPNRTPEEVLRAGSFGGTYFRPIVSAVTNVSYNAKDVLEDSVRPEWIKGLPMEKLTSKSYLPQRNKFGVKCGGSLGMWESSGWITALDPYGWFQWYCRFYQGRRCMDDTRQISRWLKSAGPKGRFRSQLCNKILAARTAHDDIAVSPVIRQTLLHWGLEITSEILEKHRKRVGK